MTQPAVFVSNQNSLRDAPGGQQLCTQEYLATVRAAGFRTRVVEFQFRRDLPSRVRRKLRPNQYRNALPDDLLERVIAAADVEKATWAFLNLTELSTLAEPLKKARPHLKIALLSHGAESVDYLHTLRIGAGRRDGKPAGVRRRLTLADQLLDEAATRPFFDHVFVLAPFEGEYERWLGAKRVTWVPRQVRPQPLDWKPVPGRIGFVATVDHPPTVEALGLFLPRLAERIQSGVHVRLVGGPVAEGRALEQTYPFVTYLGPLTDADCRCEAATWTCYPQPLFCFARGCSTKLATALAWGLPVVTTAAGARGYRWSKGGVVFAETADQSAEIAVRLALDETFREEARRDVLEAARSAPTLEEVADLVRKALEQS